jgi:RIO-like serine/threonine protein kinase
MKLFTKRFENTPLDEIRREASLQRKAAALGLAPAVRRCTSNSIVMVDLQAMCLGDKYGRNISDTPHWIQERILEILLTLRDTCKIEYTDITPFNFVEDDGVVWVIDFGDAKAIKADTPRDDFLYDVLDYWVLKWNPEYL